MGKTIGPLDQRPGHDSPWGYRSSDGLGLLEFLEWCEDLKMQPVLALFAGYTIKRDYVDSGPALQGFVDEALDEIQYVTGGPDTQWGARRAKDGHPRPFPLGLYRDRQRRFLRQIRQLQRPFRRLLRRHQGQYPRLKIIATTRVTSRVPTSSTNISTAPLPG